MKYLIKCCGRIVDVDNKPIWCIKCGEHDIEVIEFTEETLLPCPFCGGDAMAQASTWGANPFYWYECEDCGCMTADFSDFYEAKKRWNQRN
jgi:predicted nucleic acid-binding Zn ribbon protein